LFKLCLHVRHNTTNKVELVNSIIADMLCSFAGERADNWPDFVQLVEFAKLPSRTPRCRSASGTVVHYSLRQATTPADLMGQRRVTI
jgi:hypothetical protein